MTQNQQILKHLQKRPITTMEAFTQYGITRLSARIYDLRAEHDIVADTVQKGRKSYARYRLV